MIVQQREINDVIHINKRKDKTYIILTIDAKKALRKFNQVFMTKDSQELRNRINYLHILMATCERLTPNIICIGKTEAFPVMSGARPRCPLIICTHHGMGGLP